MSGSIQQVDITRLAVAMFTAASLCLSAWMLRFGVVAAGNRQGSVYVTDRWAGRTYICEPLGCRLILPAVGQVSESTGLSGSVSSTGTGRIDQVKPVSTVQAPDQQGLPTSTPSWHFVPVAGNPSDDPQKSGERVPVAGTVVDGYRFGGGDPNLESNWSLVLSQPDSKRATPPSVMPVKGWVPFPATEFLVTDPSGQKFSVTAPSVADKNFVINVARSEIAGLSPEIRSRLRPVESGKGNKDWQVTPLRP